MRILVTGGAGFLGSHLCDRLVADGHEVLCYDSMLTGNENNIAHLLDSKSFSYTGCDVTRFIDVDGPLDWVMHFASPASPIDFPLHPIHILKVGAVGSLNCLGLAKAKGAGFYLASTSEVYGDPQVHPQPESYRGNVNPIGPRSAYDESKRFAEAMAFAYHRVHNIPIRIVRFFNTYGPRMRRDDGRAVPNFIAQALSRKPITVHGDGSQTRSLAYVDDSIEGVLRLLHSEVTGPVNIGNPDEVTVLKIAETIRDLAGSESEIVFVERPGDDPERRRPDITTAKRDLGWSPTVSMREGLEVTIRWCRENWFADQPNR